MASAMGSRRQKPGRVAFPDSAKAVERGSSKEKGWFADACLITRQAYGRAIMSGHGMLLLLSSSRTV
jgi:hypothetical protein